MTGERAIRFKVRFPTWGLAIQLRPDCREFDAFAISHKDFDPESLRQQPCRSKGRSIIGKVQNEQLRCRSGLHGRLSFEFRGRKHLIEKDRSLNLTNLSDERVSPVAGLHPYQIRASLLSLITQPLAERRHRPDSTLPGRFRHTGDFSSPAIQRCVSALCIGSG